MDNNENDKINQDNTKDLYDHLYKYLLDNYEPANLTTESAYRNTEGLLMKEGITYSRKKGIGNNTYDTISSAVKKAMDHFINNNGAKSNNPDRLGKAQDGGSFNTIKQSLQDLYW